MGGALGARYADYLSALRVLANVALRATTDEKALRVTAKALEKAATEANTQALTLGVELADAKAKLGVGDAARGKTAGELDGVQRESREKLARVRLTLERFLAGEGDGSVEVD